MKVRFDDEADAEFSEAVEYVQQRSDVAGYRLIAEATAARDLLLQYPQSGTPITGGLRRLRLSRFPYDLVYVIEGDEVRILAFAHHKRKPGYWRERLKS